VERQKSQTVKEESGNFDIALLKGQYEIHFNPNARRKRHQQKKHDDDNRGLRHDGSDADASA